LAIPKRVVKTDAGAFPGLADREMKKEDISANGLDQMKGVSWMSGEEEW